MQYNPDVIASDNIANVCMKSILDPVPHTQYRTTWSGMNRVIPIFKTFTELPVPPHTQLESLEHLMVFFNNAVGARVWEV